MRYSKKHKNGQYPSELTNRHWKRLQKLLPASAKQPGKSGRPPADLRAVINAIFYVVRSGCAWRMLPREYPHWKTVYGYYWRWSRQQVWQRIHVRLVKQVRLKAHRKKRPSAAILDSASRKTTQIGGLNRGFDGGKRVWGRKRFILVDTLGLLLATRVVAANTSEKAGAQLLLTSIKTTPYLRKLCRRIRLVWADGGYQGEQLRQWVAHHWGWAWQIVMRWGPNKGFLVEPKRWIVERTFAWLSFQRRLVQDYEWKTEHSETMTYVAMISIMLKRL
jgi:putative transposase